MLSLLSRAGATVTAQIQVTNDFSDPARADELRSVATTTLPTGVTLPEVPQAGAIAGGLLGSVLIAPAGGAAPASAEQSAAVLAALTSAGFITVTGTPAAGQSVVILTGPQVTSGGSEADRAAAVAYLANQLSQSATGVVVAGRTGSEAETGTVGVIRGDTALSANVTTVDNVDTATGRLAAVLGLVEQNGGGVGRYGFADERPGAGPDAGGRLTQAFRPARPRVRHGAPGPRRSSSSARLKSSTRVTLSPKPETFVRADQVGHSRPARTGA